MPSDFAYEDVDIAVKRDEVGGRYVFGVMLDGAFIAISQRKIGGVDADIAAAKAEAEAAKSSKSKK